GFPSDEFDPDPDRLAQLMRTDEANESLPAIRASTIQFVDTHPRFADGSRRARLTDPSSELPVPRFVPAPTNGLALVSPSTNRTINSMFAEFDPPDVVVTVNSIDAEARGVADGVRVRVFNDLGAIELSARIDSAVRPGVVSIPKGLWRRHLDGNLTANALIPREVNDLAEGACFNDARVEIEVVR
ncbi:MAG TPA: molybdopterin dinucleotide binding domain-containing protein, partial [Acidimicrobiia bacterium]|nr:molybdopterin dinucleotide binding domain-containing protein [Acidimicrobiia bacterium]